MSIFGPILDGRSLPTLSRTAQAQSETGCATGEYLAEYHNNVTLSGNPALTRCEAQVNHEWGMGGRGGGIGTDNLSARWTGTHTFEAGEYTFTARTDDGMRVWVDGELISTSGRTRRRPPTKPPAP